MCTLTFGGDMDMGGNPLAVTVTIRASNDLVWKATGQRIAGPNFPQQATAPAGTVTTGIAMPATDQTGFADGNGNDILGWDYVVTVEYSNSLGRETVTKNWQPLTGQALTDFDMIPSGPATPGFTAPTGVVTSVNGQTGAVTVAASGNDTAAVHYTADSPTTTQQTRARLNLGLAPVAASGSYTDLTNTPTLSTAPWEFRPEDYGAKGDGQLAHDAATNATNTFTSAAVAATGVVGQWVMINGARGTVDVPAIGVITAINKTTNAVSIDTTARGFPINATATGLDVLWGTDDTTAINAAMTAGKTYAENHDYFFKLKFQDRIYVVSGLTQTADGNAIYNCSIPIPRPTNNNGRKLIVEVEGVGKTTHLNYWNSTTTDMAGTVIVSTQTAPNPADATYDVQSVFGAGIPQAGLAGGSGNVFINHKPVFKGIQVVVPVYTNLTGFDFRDSTGVYADVSVKAFAQVLYGTGVIMFNQYHTTVWGNHIGCGMRLPLQANNADVIVPDYECEGVALGLATPSEHTTIGTLKILYVSVVLDITSSNTGHGLVIQRVTAEGYQGGIRNETGTGMAPIFIGMWNTETSAALDGGGGYDISDSASTLTGEIRWANTIDSAHQFPIVTGGNNCRIICASATRGIQTAPTVPANTVAKQNPFWRDARVRITGGTVTAIVVGGTTMATATNSTVTVPSGKTITLTYSSAPTWTWELD